MVIRKIHVLRMKMLSCLGTSKCWGWRLNWDLSYSEAFHSFTVQQTILKELTANWIVWWDTNSVQLKVHCLSWTFGNYKRSNQPPLHLHLFIVTMLHYKLKPSVKTTLIAYRFVNFYHLSIFLRVQTSSPHPTICALCCGGAGGDILFLTFWIQKVT